MAFFHLKEQKVLTKPTMFIKDGNGRRADNTILIFGS